VYFRGEIEMYLEARAAAAATVHREPINEVSSEDR
jgi:hypothetical protein